MILDSDLCSVNLWKINYHRHPWIMMAGHLRLLEAMSWSVDGTLSAPVEPCSKPVVVFVCGFDQVLQ